MNEKVKVNNFNLNVTVNEIKKIKTHFAIQYLENHQKTGKILFLYLFFSHSCFLLVMQNHILILLYVEKYSHHSNGNWPAVYIHRRGYENEPVVHSSIHFVSEEEMVFLSLLTRVSMRH